MEKEARSLCKPTTIYSDAPAMVSVSEGGEIITEDARNLFLHWATACHDGAFGESGLAIRWATNGQRLFESEGTRYAVDDNSYLIFNNGRQFSSTIRSDTPVECGTVCFLPCFAEEVLRSLVTPADHLLDSPHGDGKVPVLFLEKTYPHDSLVSPYLFRLQHYKDSAQATYGWFEEQFHNLVVALLQSHRNVLGEVEKLPAVRAATRMELYRRLHRARDYMEASLSESITLQEMADVAWMSPHHFLRLFKQTFGETPHRYLTRRKIERAKHLLARTDVTVTEICIDLGFESLGSFSLLFRQHVGVPPIAYRSEVRR